jgi:hypothetical protein
LGGEKAKAPAHANAPSFFTLALPAAAVCLSAVVCVSQEKVRQLFDRNVVGKLHPSACRLEIIGAK